MYPGRFAPLLLALVASAQSTCRGSSNPSSQPAPGVVASDVELPGVDTGSLTPRERREWSTYVSELLAPCPNEATSIAQCVREARKCPSCLPAAKLLLKQVRDGRARSQAEEAFYGRFAADHVKTIDASDTPSKGPANAPVTIVEWADFECPHCGRAAPLLDKLPDEFPGQVRILFKFYPLGAHLHGEAAARAAAAAIPQGKFWEMHHTIFEHQDALEPRDLEKYAKEIGLDVPKWKAALDSEAVADRVSRDRKQGDALGITGTPTMFINGREYDLHAFHMGDDLHEWIDLEIALAGGASAPAAASAAPPAAPPASAKK